MPLVLQREPGESIVLITGAGECIEILLEKRTGPDGTRVTLAVDAPRSVRVMRKELLGKALPSAGSPPPR